MTTPIAIVIGALMIAVAVLLTGHWQVMPNQAGIPTVFRLNRWTGAIDMCVLDPDTMRNPNSVVGAELICKSK